MGEGVGWATQNFSLSWSLAYARGPRGSLAWGSRHRASVQCYTTVARCSAHTVIIELFALLTPRPSLEYPAGMAETHAARAERRRNPLRNETPYLVGKPYHTQFEW